MIYPLAIGCTAMRHKAIGIHAVVNARGGLQCLNQQTMEDIALMRDGLRIRARLERRVRFYQFESRFFRRHIGRVGHLLSRPDD